MYISLLRPLTLTERVMVPSFAAHFITLAITAIIR